MDDKRFLFGYLFSVSNKLQVVGDLFLGEMTAKQWLLLECIARQSPAHPSLTQLSSTIGSSRQNIKQLALKLQSLGYARIIPAEDDRREVCVALTEKATEFLSSRYLDSTEFLNALFEGLSPAEIDATLHTLKTLDANVHRLHGEFV